MVKIASAIICLVAIPAWALAADKSAADSCARKLDPQAKQIYDMTAPEVKASSVIKDIVVEKVRPLVMAGTMSRDNAR